MSSEVRGGLGRGDPLLGINPAARFSITAMHSAVRVNAVADVGHQRAMLDIAARPDLPERDLGGLARGERKAQAVAVQRFDPDNSGGVGGGGTA